MEQSVDIDADYLATDLAPTDMMLQRVGRLWRHPRLRRPCDAQEVLVLLQESMAAVDIETETARELKAALGPPGRVYAPYVLLRSLAEWRTHSSLILPDDIRALLEATYNERAHEPTAWRELHVELDAKRETLRRLAFNNTSVWNQPALADEDGVQTRYNSSPSAGLLMARDVQPVAKGCARVTLISGGTIEAPNYDWGFAAAKGIHKNLVRVPRYSVAAALSGTPAWLRLHTSGETALGMVRGGEIYWPGSDQPSGLSWHPDEGVFIPSHLVTKRSTDSEDDYESLD